MLLDIEDVLCGDSNCDVAYVHPVCVTVNRGGIVTTIDRTGERIDAGCNPSGRGVMIRLDFSCECGHAFAIIYQFHKGATSVSREEVGSEASVPAGTIWRD
jgi:hypothetical protein